MARNLSSKLEMSEREAKLYIRSLLNSSVLSYDVSLLLSDFKLITGVEMPLFGHKTAEGFLKSLKDTVKLIGNRRNPTVALVASKNSAHITSLVNKQKIRKKNFGQDQSILRRIVVAFSPEPSENDSAQRPDRRRRRSNSTNGDYRNNQNSPGPGSSRSHRNHRRNRGSAYWRQLSPPAMNDARDSSNGSQEMFQNAGPSRANVPGRSQEADRAERTDRTDSCYFEDFSDMDSYVSDESNRAPLNQESPEPEVYVNDGMKAKLQDLIKKYPEGLWCCALPESFFTEYNSELNYREFGCTSLIEMLAGLPDVFRCVRPGSEDWILFDASAPPSETEKKLKSQENAKNAGDMANNLRRLLVTHFSENGVEMSEIPNLYKVMFDAQLDFHSLGFPSLKEFLKTFEGDMLNMIEEGDEVMVKPIAKAEAGWEALPPITKDSDIFRELFPSDVVGPDENYPEVDLRFHIAIGQRIELSVAEVWSPGEFCIQLNKFRKQWTRFSNDLQSFYNTYMSKYKMPDATVLPNQVCAALYSEDPESPDEWNRAKILQVVNDRIVKVEFVDFGTVARVRKTHLRFLHKSFQTFPMQAFPAELYNVGPKNGEPWSVTACEKFLEWSRVAYLVAELIEIDFKKPLLSIVLYDITKKININAKLISENFGELISPAKEMKTLNSGVFEMSEKYARMRGIASGEFSESSDVDSECCTALFRFRMRSHKAERQGDSDSKDEAKEKAKEPRPECKEVPEWNQFEETPEPPGSVLNKINSEIENLFDVVDEPPREEPKLDQAAEPEQNPQEEAAKRPPPGLERLVEVNRFRMLPLEQPDEIKKKINIITIELLTVNPSIKQVAIQDPSIALKMASEMAEVYARWTCCYNVSLYGPNRFTDYMPYYPQYMAPLPMAYPEGGIFAPVPSNLPLQTVRQNQGPEPSTSAEALRTKPNERNKFIEVVALGGKLVHVAIVNEEIYFFAEELIRAFTTFANRDIADRVLHLKKIVIDYKILNKRNGESLLNEVKSFEIPGVKRKRSKQWNLYLVPAKIVNSYLQGLGSETKLLDKDLSFKQPSKGSR